jgi:DnaJ-class molecular chaperone
LKRSNVKIKIYDNDLFIDIPKSIINTSNLDICTTIHISLFESLCGFSKIITTPDNENVKITYENIIKPDDVFILENYGLPCKNNKYIRGKLFIKIIIDYPSEIPPQIKNILKQHLFENTKINEKELQFKKNINLIKINL